MGFAIEEQTAALEFAEGTLLAGATVRVSLDMSVRQFVDLQRVVAAMDGSGAELSSAEKMARLESAFTQFAEAALISWDLERKDIPIPSTAEGFMSLPFPHANAIFQAWTSALANPSPNSGAASVPGAAAAGQSPSS